MVVPFSWWKVKGNLKTIALLESSRIVKPYRTIMVRKSDSEKEFFFWDYKANAEELLKELMEYCMFEFGYWFLFDLAGRGCL